jgi:hypothetical protein
MFLMRLLSGANLSAGFVISCLGVSLHFGEDTFLMSLLSGAGLSVLSGAGLPVGFLMCFLGEGLPVGGQFS